MPQYLKDIVLIIRQQNFQEKQQIKQDNNGKSHLPFKSLDWASHKVCVLIQIFSAKLTQAFLYLSDTNYKKWHNKYEKWRKEAAATKKNIIECIFRDLRIGSERFACVYWWWWSSIHHQMSVCFLCQQTIASAHTQQSDSYSLKLNSWGDVRFIAIELITFYCYVCHEASSRDTVAQRKKRMNWEHVKDDIKVYI